MVAYSNKRLLVLLSSSELLQGMFATVIFVHRIEQISREAFNTVNALSQISRGVGYSGVMLITLNRLLSTIYPFKYQRTMTKVKFALMVVSGCTLRTSLYVTFSMIPLLTRSISTFITYRVLDNLLFIFYFIFCTSTYTVIFITILKSRWNLQTNDENDAMGTSASGNLQLHKNRWVHSSNFDYPVLRFICCISTNSWNGLFD